MTTRERLLSILKAHKGTWVSGEHLSNELRVTRSAIWKHVSWLKGKDYIIESMPKRGYRLKEISSRMLPEEIRQGLENSVFGKREIIHVDEVDSTNRMAKDLAIKGTPEGTLVIAERQTRGRGRMDRDWFSPPGEGIYMTMVLRPSLPPAEAPKITLLTGVAMAESLREISGIEVKIKWPNDIVIKGKKLAGILTELSAEIDAINFVLIGIGVNVNTEEFPGSLQEMATSLLIETGRHFSRAPLIRVFLSRSEAYYEESKRRGFDGIIRTWNDLTDTIGRRVRIETLGKVYTGEALRVDTDGALILKDESGALHRIVSGDVNVI